MSLLPGDAHRFRWTARGTSEQPGRPGRLSPRGGRPPPATRVDRFVDGVDSTMAIDRTAASSSWKRTGTARVAPRILEQMTSVSGAERAGPRGARAASSNDSKLIAGRGGDQQHAVAHALVGALEAGSAHRSQARQTATGVEVLAGSYDAPEPPALHKVVRRAEGGSRRHAIRGQRATVDGTRLTSKTRVGSDQSHLPGRELGSAVPRLVQIRNLRPPPSASRIDSCRDVVIVRIVRMASRRRRDWQRSAAGRPGQPLRRAIRSTLWVGMAPRIRQQALSIKRARRCPRQSRQARRSRDPARHQQP